MAVRPGHGAGAGVPHVEIVPIDELPVGVAAPQRPAQAAIARTETGQLATSEAARELGRRGGSARKGTTRLANDLGLAPLAATEAFAPYKRSAENFKRLHVAHLAATVGGGFCGPAPSSMVASAALQLAASRYFFDRGEFEKGSKLANDSRQNLAAAHEYSAKEALARPKAPPSWWQPGNTGTGVK